MVQVFNAIREMINCELEKMTKRGELDKAMLENLDKLVDILKDLDEIEGKGSMEEIGMYSNRYGGNSYRMMPRNGYYYDDGYSRNDGMYSRANGQNPVIEHLHKAMDQAQNESERQAIRNALEKLNMN